jgi:hypothetical protein
MGLSIAGSNIGGAFPWDIVPAQGTGYQYQSAPVSREFTDLDLYLMGSAARRRGQPPRGTEPEPAAVPGCAVAVSTVTINDIVGSQERAFPMPPRRRSSSATRP